MKKTIYFLASLFAAGTIAAQSVPDGGFENWTTNVWQDPTGYSTSNDQYVPNGFPANVVQTTNAYTGCIYAVQLTTTKSGNDTNTAYVANGNPTSSPFSGGIPYTGLPTGIRLHYMCNIPAGDSAVIAVLFKKSGNLIGGAEYKVGGLQANWTLLEKTFSPALFIEPDSMMFAITSSANILNNKNGIPGGTVTIDSVMLLGAAQPLDLNGILANWTSDTDAYPTGWIGSYPGVYKTTDAYSGSYAAELVTYAGTINNGGQAQPAEITTGNNNNNYNAGGYPFTTQIDTLSFYYKYVPVGTDNANVQLQFKKNGSVIWSTGNSLLAASNYTLAKVPFNTGSTPDSVIVSFQSTQDWNNAGAHVGSTLKVDNVVMGGQPLGFANITKPASISVYPNPVANMLNVNTAGLSGSIRQIAIYDICGKMMESANYDNSAMNNNLLHFNMSNYAPGLYIMHINTTTGDYYQKITKAE